MRHGGRRLLNQKATQISSRSECDTPIRRDPKNNSKATKTRDVTNMASLYKLDMSLRCGSWVRRLRIVDGVPAIHMKALLQVIFLKPFFLPLGGVFCYIYIFFYKTPSWGRGTGRRGPSRGATERRLELGHKWNVRVISGYGHYKSKTFEDVVASVPPGVDPSDWLTMCEKWNTREEQTHQREPNRMEVFRMGRCKDLHDGTQRWKRMTQMTTPSLQSDDAALVLVENAFIAVMGRDRPGRVCCAGKVETLRTWYERREGSSSSGGYHTQVQQL
ncbi:hypothetical protein Taro_002947 [Colocasia esculenta]|uniref:Uncharacterized protein n=1 Tax=Colocasia esculenta TaxID=4460 RepID=A0A843TFM0_COLES|nr:hypothetical protein [Colocasia esculenta]